MSKVIPPLDPVGDHNFFQWSSDSFKKWKADAIRMQEAHVKDNSRTKWFRYKTEERDALELRILITIFGLRIPVVDESKGAPSSPMRTYTREERKEARKLKKKLIKHSSTPENVDMNVIYVSTAMKIEGEEELYASEEPVFLINGNKKKFIDNKGRTYIDFQDFKVNNKLPKAAMIAPKDGTYSPEKDGEATDVVLEANETVATEFSSRVLGLAGKVITIAGIALTVANIVLMLSPDLYSKAALLVLQAGSFFLSGVSVIGTIVSIYDKVNHDESIRTEIFILVSTILSTCVSIGKAKINEQLSTYARQGKTFTEAMKNIGKFKENIFLAANIFSLLSSASAFVSTLYNLYNKREHSWLDYYQLSMSLFMFVNVLTQVEAIKSFFESEQMKCLEEMNKSLETGEAKNEMEKFLKNHETFDKKAYVIRNLSKIENRTEFFELIGTVNSSVICTADGLAVNNAIDIAPEAFSNICKSVFMDKFNQIQAVKNEQFEECLRNKFRDIVPVERRGSFEGKLGKMKNLPMEQQKEKMKGIVRMPEDEFNILWDQAKNCYTDIVDNKITQFTTNLKQGVSEQEKAADFTELERLAKRNIHGNNTPEEQKQLATQLDKCSRHRKEYFLKSSKIPSELSVNDDPNANAQNANLNSLFRQEINTFTNAKNERLCYRVNVEDVKQELRSAFGVTNHEEILIREKKIFKNMKIGDYDRLNRVINDYKKAELSISDILTAAKQIAEDPAFEGIVNFPSDIASITEFINAERVFVYKTRTQREQFLTDLRGGNGESYVQFRQNFNQRIVQVNALGNEIKTQWSSILSMVYHWKKHERDFIGIENTVNQYFEEYSRNIFNQANITGTSYSQSGMLKNTYTTSFGTRVHVGFTYSEPGIKASHFPKNFKDL